MRAGSEDIAIIELKKAVALNPSFNEALNLLAICYAYVGENDKAVELLNRVVEAEHNSVQAVKYLNDLEGPSSYSEIENRKVKKKNNPVTKTKVEKNARAKSDIQKALVTIGKGLVSDPTKYILGSIVGLVAGLFIGFLVFSSAGGDNHGDTIVDMPSQQTDTKTVEEDKDVAENTADKDMEIKNLSDELSYYKSVVQLFEADKLAAEKNYEAAASLLLTLKTVEMRGSEKERFDSLYKNVVPKVTDKLFNEGNKLMTSRKYEEAIEKFKKILLYGLDVPNMDRNLYYTGKCFTSLNDTANAIDSFQKVKDNFPGTRYAQYSENRLKDLMRTS